MASTHFQLHQPVKIDGVDFEPGVYPIEDIDAGRRGSICNAGWGDYCDAPKAKAKAADAKAKTNDDDEADDAEGFAALGKSAAQNRVDVVLDEVAKPKPARSRKKPPAK